MKTIELFEHDRALLQKGYLLLAGMDEAGRGPLAGPVTAGICVMNLTDYIDGINDSKKLSEKKRTELYKRIVENALGFSVIDVDNRTIDSVNILNATKRAMQECVRSLLPFPDLLLIDAVKEDFGVPSVSIIHGDAISYSIAAASILAKVHRDELMAKYDETYPEYGFAKHKGYGTKEHIEALKKYGPCPIHRQTFIKNFFA